MFAPLVKRACACWSCCDGNQADSALAVIDSPKTEMASSPSKMPTKPIQVVKGDLFSSPATDSLAHCISEDVRMGAGIAVLFKKKFGRIRELKNQNKKPGEVAFLKDADRYVYYLITKKKASDKPTYESLQKSLEAMRDHCLDNNVSHISMPRIGCGLDKLLWTEVSKILESVFAESGIMITVYSL